MEDKNIVGITSPLSKDLYNTYDFHINNGKTTKLE